MKLLIEDTKDNKLRTEMEGIGREMAIGLASLAKENIDFHIILNEALSLANKTLYAEKLDLSKKTK